LHPRNHMELIDLRIVFYETLCGCIYEKQKLIKGLKGIHNRLQCPVHHEELKSKFSHCMQCSDKIVATTVQSKIPILCPVCDPGFEKRRKCETDKRNRATAEINSTESYSELSTETLIERSNCVYRPLCFEINIKKSKLPCLGCKEFIPAGESIILFYDINLKDLDSVIGKIISPSTEIDQKTIEKMNQIGKERWGIIFEKRTRDLQLKKLPKAA